MVLRDFEVCVVERSADSIKSETDIFCKPFDLENGPLFRFEYLTTPEGDAFLSDVHHIVFDGTSLNLMFSQIADVYNGGACPGEEVTLFDAQIQNGQKEQAIRNLLSERLGAIDCNAKPVSD